MSVINNKLFSCIDIGSNSVVLSICEVNFNNLNEVLHLSFVTELGKGLSTKSKFDDSSIEKTKVAFYEIKNKLKNLNVPESNLFVTGTEACRVAENAELLQNLVKSVFGTTLEIVSGEREAELCLRGQELLGLKLTEATLVDIGGASTEVISKNFIENRLNFTKSYKIGVVKLREQLKGHDDRGVAILSDIFHDIPSGFFKGKKVFFSAGSMTTFASMLIKDTSIDPDRINGLSLTSSYVTEEIDKFLDMSDNELMTHYPQVLKRIKRIKQGMMIVRFLIENKNLSELVFTTFGLRHGVLVEKVNS